jgi:HSF-type DNA-binding
VDITALYPARFSNPSRLYLSHLVQQLNFYSFRKIKFIDSIRIDPKLEAETANYWRFRHEHFRRDRPDLLSQIKRMNSAPRNPSAAATAAAAAVASAAVAVPTSVASSTTAAAKPNAVPSAAEAVATVSDKAVTTEVQILKKRIEEMNKNLGELTAMVQKVNLKQEEQETSTSDSAALPGTKSFLVALAFWRIYRASIIVPRTRNKTPPTSFPMAW